MFTCNQFSYQKLFLYVCLTGLLIVSCRPPQAFRQYQSEKQVFSKQAVVVSAHPLASAAGMEILRKGGNAMDAAIATQFALAVTYPRASALGGGGFMVYRDEKGKITSLDFREKAPLGATETMYLNEEGLPVDSLSRYGVLAVGVPGTVKAMHQAYRRYGAMEKWETLLKPAIKLADRGFYITEATAEALNDIQDDLKRFSPGISVFEREIPWQAGDLLRQKKLKKTLQRIAENGSEEWENGLTVRRISQFMEDQNGLIRLEDFQKYEPQWREPVRCDFNEFTISSMGPPSSGGITLCQMLGMLESFLPLEYDHHSPEMIQLFTEIQRRAYADRVAYIGDKDFVEVPIAKLLDSSYLIKRMSGFTMDSASTSKRIQGGLSPDQYGETSHFSVVDGEGRAVSMTVTLNSWFGSKVMVPGTGFFLNNEMDDFTSKPGYPNQFGLIGSKANRIAPEKRMVSSMTPTIIEKKGDLFMIIGTPGGSTIPNAVLQVFTNVVLYNMSLAEAIQKKRFHHQWLPDIIFTEKNAFSKSVFRILQEKGYHIETRPPIGRVDAILKQSDGRYEGAADIRMDDDAEGL